jgi:hypothetical protein
MARETAGPLYINYHPLDNLYRMNIGRRIARICGWQPQQLLQVTLSDDLVVTVKRIETVCVLCHRPDVLGTGMTLNPGTEDARMICRTCLDTLQMMQRTDQDGRGRS